MEWQDSVVPPLAAAVATIVVSYIGWRIVEDAGPDSRFAGTMGERAWERLQADN
jgi:hypothetical protein